MDNKRVEELEKLAKDLGLDFFPVIFETVSKETMNNICSYGLPTRARHWSYGRSYDHQKTYGEMGYSKVYEVILNNNPSYAFLLDTNSEVQNLFVASHCFSHSSFFKENCMFQKTDRNMISHSAEHAGRIEDYIEKYGLEKVEHLMDICFALDEHIDWHKGVYRKAYPNRQMKTFNPQKKEFDDLLDPKKSFKPIKKVINKKIPPHPEKDLLWFIMNYAPLEDWEKDVLDIIREESHYFYPQKMTKIMNEGWASYWHAEIMYNYTGLSSQEYLDFVRDHEKVVRPGSNPFRINPYFLGFRIFKDIEKRWDKEHGAGAGKKKIFEVMKNEDDVSFLRNYLTTDLVQDLKLFTYGYANCGGSCGSCDDCGEPKYIEIKERLRDEVVETLVKPLYNCGVPKITVQEIGKEGTLVLKHESEEVGVLEQRFASKTLEYLWDLWAAPIELHTLNDDGSPLVLYFDEGGYQKINSDDEMDFSEDDEEEEEVIRFV